VLLGITTLARLLIALWLPLTGDEAYFWEWARHPALCYYDHPPMAGWILWLSKSVLGDTVLAVRLPAVITGTLIPLLIYGFTLELTASKRIAAGTGILAAGLPLLAGLGILYSTDTPLILASAAGGWLLYRALDSDSMAAWAGAGSCFAVIVLSKFLGAPILAAAAAAMVIMPEYRQAWRRPGPYLAMGITVLGFIPVLVWNASNGWATFVFNFASRHSEPSLELTRTLNYLLGQFAISGFLPMALLVPASIYILRRRSRSPGTVIPALMALFPLVGFLVISPLSEVGLHWTAAAYPFLALTVGIYLLKPQAASPRLYRMTTGAAWAATTILLTVMLLLGTTPKLMPADWKFPLRPDRINSDQLKKARVPIDATGEAVREALAELSASGTAFVFTRSYSLSSLVGFYTPDNPEVTVLGRGSAHGRNHLLWFDPADHLGESAVYVTYREMTEEAGFILERFDRYVLAADLGNVRVVKCYGYNGVR
jgi:dolichol-phosphate mannosyltransferase